MPGNDGIRRASFGIFDRAGFGTVTFRRDSMAATLFAVQNDDRWDFGFPDLLVSGP